MYTHTKAQVLLLVMEAVDLLHYTGELPKMITVGIHTDS